MSSSSEPILIDTEQELKNLLNLLVDLHPNEPEIFIDLEGDDIGSGGKLSLMQILFYRQKRIFLLDLLTLGKQAFFTEGGDNRTLKEILEGDTPKALFDCRADANSLYMQYGVRLSAVHDIQLMELATRAGQARFVKGLAKCIESDADLDYSQLKRWNQGKESGRKAFDKQYGGSFSVFDQRPLSREIQIYCEQDVKLLPTLWLKYFEKIGKDWDRRLQVETESRLQKSQKMAPINIEREMARAPPKWIGLPRNNSHRSASHITSQGCQSFVDCMEGTIDTQGEVAAKCFEPRSPNVGTLGLNNLNISTPTTQTSPSTQYHWGSYDDRVFERGHDFDEDDSDKDFTACSADDCGYCGHCSY